jgi:hypothetical protein
MNELLINGENAYTTWGVRMGDGFLDVLGASSPMKEFIENKSRLEHGKRVIINNPKVDEREITLSFKIPSPIINQRKKLSSMSFIKVRLIFKSRLIVAKFTILFILARVSLTHRV